jgi:hypothetical protein
MKTARSFRPSWLFPAIAAVIIIAEVAAWEIAAVHGIKTGPLSIGLLASGLVAAITMVLGGGSDVG